MQKLGTADEVVSYILSEIAIYVRRKAPRSRCSVAPQHLIPVGTSQITTNMLRNNLPVILEPHMAYHCYAKKYGTVVYRHGGDLLFT